MKKIILFFVPGLLTNLGFAQIQFSNLNDVFIYADEHHIANQAVANLPYFTFYL